MMRFAAYALVVLGCSKLPGPTLPLARTPDADFRRFAPPLIASAGDLRLPRTESRTLQNGLLVTVVSRKELPVVTAGLVVRDAGLSADHPQPAAALITALAIIEPPEELLDARTSRDAAFLGFTTTREQFQTTAYNFAVAVRTPTFDSAAIAAGRRHANDWVARTEGRSFVESIANELLYEQPPPVLRASTASIDTIDRATFVHFHRDRYRPESSAFILVGALDPPEAFETAERLFGNWAAAPAPQRAPRSLPRLVPRMGLRPISAIHVQADVGHARFAIPGPGSGDPGLPAFELLAATLGGSITSRGFSSLRLHDAATYGVNAEVNTQRDRSELVIDFSTEKRDLVPSVKRMLGEIERLRREPLSLAELGRVKTIWQANVADALSNNPRTTMLLAMRFALGDDPGRLHAYLSRMMSVDPQALLAVAKSAFGPERIQISVIGDSKEVAVPLSHLGPVIWDTRQF
jgi:predicted Zn-dependent peptidase